jgi:hypothetical protein
MNLDPMNLSRGSLKDAPLSVALKEDMARKRNRVNLKMEKRF